MFYPITTPDGQEILPIRLDGSEGRWRVGKAKIQELLKAGLVEFERQADGKIEVYKIIPQGHETYSAVDSILNQQEVRTTADGSKEVKSMLGEGAFEYPKPIKLISYLFGLISNGNDIILDSFAGSGTTGHAVLDMNKVDGGNRRFILVEMEQDVCRDVTAQRLIRIVKGYEKVNGEKTVKVEGLGGGFRYCKLDKPLFDETGKIGESVKFADLAAHVFFTETGIPIPKRTNGASPFLGTANGTGYYLLFNGILGDKTPEGGNVLTGKVLAGLPAHNGTKVIFGEGCRLGDARLRREQITFKQLPYEIKVS
jgi:site-specific DNA-methyltransferase (adenine-specific)/adenine-specific DNA-methyltransferase